MRLTVNQPSLLDTSPVVVSTLSTIATAQPVSNPFCPTVAPFNVSLGIRVRAGGSIPVTVTGIRFVFTDVSGRRAPEVTLPMLPVTLPAPSVQFGSAHAGSEQLFPFVLGIGCGTGRRGTAIVIVDTSHDGGRRSEERVVVEVR